MDAPAPRVAVVVATRDRAGRLKALLESLRAQTLPREAFEVVVVDDGSMDGTAALLEREAARADLRLTVVRQPVSGGAARARNAGWRASRAPVIAFTDDDCEATPGWLAAGLEACLEQADTIVQGPIEPNPAELDAIGPYTRTLNVPNVTPYFQTSNVFYPRALLDRTGGFDDEMPLCGEDVDLGWRALGAGGRASFASEAIVYHAVHALGPIGKLRVAARWGAMVRAYARHPGLRRAGLDRRFFWKGHYLLVRALVALLLPSRVGGRSLRRLRWWLGAPYVKHLVRRKEEQRAHLWHIPFLVVEELVELFAIARAAVRYRVPML